MNHIKNSVTPAKAEPGAEAAEPSPGETAPMQEPSAADLAQVETHVSRRRKKVADEGAADLDQPAFAKS